MVTSKVEIRSNMIPQMAGGMDSRMSQVIQKIVFDIESETKQNIATKYHAVDTGAMLNETEGHMNDATHGEVNVPAEYAGYVHDGYERGNGSYVAGRPFMSDAVETVKSQVPAEVQILTK